MSETIESIVNKFIPHGTTLMCIPIVAAEKSAGGIIIPEQARNPLNQGRVIAVGDQLNEDDWKTGMVVMYRQHSESKLKIDDIELVLVGIDDVLLRTRLSV